MEKYEVLVIGGGAAGMMAAISAAESGAKVTILERNEKLGKKIYITGKGRCNLTNACDKEDFYKNVTSNPRFLYSSFETFDNVMTMDFFKSIGLDIKVERGNRVFPVSDHASDVIKVLKERLSELGVNVILNAHAEDIVRNSEGFKVTYSDLDTKKIKCCMGDRLIIATGGKSYPTTGSTGDGYVFSEKLGHTVTKLMPSLVSITLSDDYVSELAGLSLKNVSITLKNEKGKVLYKETGEMLFTHTGISGPLILSSSSFVSEALIKGKGMPKISLDLKPGLSLDELDQRILKDFEGFKNRDFKNSLDLLLPKSLIPVVVSLSGIDPEKQVNSVTKEERRHLAELFKNVEFHPVGTGSYNEAVVTKGGVNVKEVDPKTFESKLVPGLYFAGEVLDLDAFTGGFNLQIAWSTGRAAGIGAAL